MRRKKFYHVIKFLLIAFGFLPIQFLLIMNVEDQKFPYGIEINSADENLKESYGYTQALNMCDWLVDRQTVTGAIPDTVGSTWTNQDSNMEYALIALGAAYQITCQIKYLNALEKGIDWLFARQVTTSNKWNGSFWYVYDCYETDPTKHIVAGEDGIYDTRGVDATSTLAVYLLYLDNQLNSSSTKWQMYRNKAIAGLNFVINNNWYQKEPNGNGWSLSSWIQTVSGGAWTLWEYQYTADQLDVWLGLRAGYLLYGNTNSNFGQKADYIKDNLPTRFYDQAAMCWAVGIEDDIIDTESDGFNSIFPIGYITWGFGNCAHAIDNYNWLNNLVKNDGSINAGGDNYSLNVAMLGFAAKAVDMEQPNGSFDWLLTVPYDPNDGSVRDTASSFSEKYINVAGFCAMSLLGWSPDLSGSAPSDDNNINYNRNDKKGLEDPSLENPSYLLFILLGFTIFGMAGLIFYYSKKRYNN